MLFLRQSLASYRGTRMGKVTVARRRGRARPRVLVIVVVIVVVVGRRRSRSLLSLSSSLLITLRGVSLSILM